MTEPILCPACGHDIDEHREGTCCLGCMAFVPDDFCSLKPSDIARAYAKKCFHEGWDACELQWAVRHSE